MSGKYTAKTDGKAVAIVRAIVISRSQITGEPNGYTYEAVVYRRNDCQRQISCCYHNHRSEAAAEKCCRRLEREWNKTLELIDDDTQISG